MMLHDSLSKVMNLLMARQEEKELTKVNEDSRLFECFL